MNNGDNDSFALFEQVRQLSPEERERLLLAHPNQRVAERVRLLLAHDVSDSFLYEPVGDVREVLAAGSGFPQPPDPLRGGSIVRPEGYEVGRVLGHGGSGVVYEANTVGTTRRVAIKILRDELLTERDIERFRFEGLVLGHIDHPGIVSVHSVGWSESGGLRRPFIVMDLVEEGLPITQYAAQMELSHSERIALVADASSAVVAAHAAGVVHRDLKPGNILVGKDGRVRVIDFGIATAAHSARTLGTLVTTASGSLIGTLAYMSPEQLRGEDPGEKSDLYALGVVLYETLVGSLPFACDESNLFELFDAIRSGRTVPPRDLDRSLPRGLQLIIERAMQPSPHLRYLSMNEMEEDLRRFVRGEGVLAASGRHTRRIRRTLRRRSVRVAGLVATAGLISLVAGIALPRDVPPAPPFRVAVAGGHPSIGGQAYLAAYDATDRLLGDVSMTGPGRMFTRPGRVGCPASPLGERLLFVEYSWDDPATPITRLWDMASDEAVTLGSNSVTDLDGNEAPKEAVASNWTDTAEIFGESAGEEIIVVCRRIDGYGSRITILSSSGKALQTYWFPGEVVAARAWNRVDGSTPMPPRLLVLGHDPYLDSSTQSVINPRILHTAAARIGPMVIAAVDLDTTVGLNRWIDTNALPPRASSHPVADARQPVVFYRTLVPADLGDLVFFPWDAIRFTGPDRDSTVRIRLYGVADAPEGVDSYWEAYDLLLSPQGHLRTASRSQRATELGLPSVEELGISVTGVAHPAER